MHVSQRGIEHWDHLLITGINLAIIQQEIMKEIHQNNRVAAHDTKTGQTIITDEEEAIREKEEGADQEIRREVDQKNINVEVEAHVEDPEKHPDANLQKITQGHRLDAHLHLKQKVTMPIDPLLSQNIKQNASDYSKNGELTTARLPSKSPRN